MKTPGEKTVIYNRRDLDALILDYIKKKTHAQSPQGKYPDAALNRISLFFCDDVLFYAGPVVDGRWEHFNEVASQQRLAGEYGSKIRSAGFDRASLNEELRPAGNENQL